MGWPDTGLKDVQQDESLYEHRKTQQEGSKNGLRKLDA